MITLSNPLARPTSWLPDADEGLDGADSYSASIEGALDEYSEQLASDPHASAERLRMRFPEHHGDIDRLVQAATTPHSCAFADLPPLTSPFAPDPPTRLGPYHLAGRIGFGGMGYVYRATHPEHPGRPFAAKILRPELREPRFQQRFEAECRLTAELKHRNIVRFIDSDARQASQPPHRRRCPYLIMQRIDGTDLMTHCRQQQLSLPLRLKLFLQVCDGVAWMHRNGILHRDLKPTNILVAAERDRAVPKIIDFGLACSMTRDPPGASACHESARAESVYEVLGTLSYMSPERATRSPGEMDVRSDVFSLGVLLFELLTGTVPLSGVLRSDDSIEKQLRFIGQQQPVRPSVRVATLSGSCPASISRFDTLLEAALANAPQNRLSSAQELAQNAQKLLHLIDDAAPPREQSNGT